MKDDLVEWKTKKWKKKSKKCRESNYAIRNITVTRFLSAYPIDYHRWHKFKRWLEGVRFLTVRCKQIVAEGTRDAIGNYFARILA